jgi:hypothetical protein
MLNDIGGDITKFGKVNPAEVANDLNEFFEEGG